MTIKRRIRAQDANEEFAASLRAEGNALLKTPSTAEYMGSGQSQPDPRIKTYPQNQVRQVPQIEYEREAGKSPKSSAVLPMLSEIGVKLIEKTKWPDWKKTPLR